jgi:hypothetical protein
VALSSTPSAGPPLTTSGPALHVNLRNRLTGLALLAIEDRDPAELPGIAECPLGYAPLPEKRPMRGRLLDLLGIGRVLGWRRCHCDGVARDVAVALALSRTVWSMQVCFPSNALAHVSHDAGFQSPALGVLLQEGVRPPAT